MVLPWWVYYIQGLVSAVLSIDPGFAKIVSIALSLKRRLGVVAVHKTDYKNFPML